MRSTVSIGNEKEKEACSFIEAEGSSVIDTNYRALRYEIDIIAKDNDTIAFIEVKYRSNDVYGGAAYAVNKHKQYKIRMAAQQYIFENLIISESNMRFDVITINGSKIEWIKNAF